MGEYRKGHFTHAQIKKGDKVYMDRWYILCFPKLFSVRIHHIMLPDLDRWPHDQPWSFFSIILKGWYVEQWCTPEEFRTANRVGTITAPPFWEGYWLRLVNRFSFHRNTDLHKIIRFGDNDKGVWTLIFTGAEKREWGFMTDKGWVSRLELNLGASEPRGPHGPEPD